MVAKNTTIELGVSEETFQAAKLRCTDLEDRISKFVQSVAEMGTGEMSHFERDGSRGRTVSHSIASTSIGSSSTFGSSSSVTEGYTTGTSCTQSSSKKI